MYVYMVVEDIHEVDSMTCNKSRAPLGVCKVILLGRSCACVLKVVCGHALHRRYRRLWRKTRESRYEVS